MSILNFIIFGLHGKRVQKFQKKVVLFSLFDCFSFSIFEIVFLAGIVKLICWSVVILLSFLFNSLDCISGPVLLCFFNFV